MLRVVVSLSLYGSKPIYTDGAKMSVQAICAFESEDVILIPRVYVDTTVASNVQEELRELGADVVDVSYLNAPLEARALWRYLAFSEPAAIIQDADDGNIATRELNILIPTLLELYKKGKPTLFGRRATYNYGVEKTSVMGGLCGSVHLDIDMEVRIKRYLSTQLRVLDAKLHVDQSHKELARFKNFYGQDEVFLGELGRQLEECGSPVEFILPPSTRPKRSTHATTLAAIGNCLQIMTFDEHDLETNENDQLNELYRRGFIGLPDIILSDRMKSWWTKERARATTSTGEPYRTQRRSIPISLSHCPDLSNFLSDEILAVIRTYLRTKDLYFHAEIIVVPAGATEQDKHRDHTMGSRTIVAIALSLAESLRTKIIPGSHRGTSEPVEEMTSRTMLYDTFAEHMGGAWPGKEEDVDRIFLTIFAKCNLKSVVNHYGEEGGKQKTFWCLDAKGKRKRVKNTGEVTKKRMKTN